MTGSKKPNVPAPPGSLRRGLLVSVPTPTLTPDNLSRPAAGLQDLNFKVENDFHRNFKLVATEKGMSMKELLEASFHAWVDRYGDDRIRALIRALRRD